jgi:non-heme chloroperoxidase
LKRTRFAVKGEQMSFLKVGSENQTDIKLYYTDHGRGEPVILIHGYPFSGMAWERQEAFLLEQGYRVITYDRRGFGKSSQPSKGYDYDTFASDLDTLINTLDLTGVTLIGHSMGTGEIARYIGKFGSSKVSRAIMVSPIPPFLLKTPDNETGVERQIFEDFKQAIKEDRYAFMTEFLDKFYSRSFMNGEKVSDEKLRADFNLGVSSSPIGFLRCVDSWIEDFRDDVESMHLPLLVVQGDDDQILPLESTGKALTSLKGELHVISGGSHGIPWTHADEINQAMMKFMEKNPRLVRERASEQMIQRDMH